MIKHLEDLEAELDCLVVDFWRGQKGDCSFSPITNKIIKNSDNPTQATLNYCLMQRAICNAYDAIEERKAELKKGESGLVTDYGICILTADAILKGIFPKELSFDYAKKTFCSIFKVSDYEWEWLSKQEGKDD